MTSYENLQKERSHIAAAVKRECSITTALKVLQSLDIQEREIQRLNERILLFDNMVLNITPPNSQTERESE